ncbi:MAG: murein transglycosylase, partial [Steroidobacteraceae bacterium]
MRVGAATLLLGALLAACSSVPVKTQPGTATPALPPIMNFEPVAWNALPGWAEDDPAAAWPALLASCRAPRMPPAWGEFCRAAAAVDARNGLAQRALIETRLRAYRVVTRNQDGKRERFDQGLITGYYEPVLHG